uniref:SAM domain-containing protein n=1 Tax=Panagrellus redivivus TaxID=6233 RepID=A0A7E4V7V6_PANRE
MSSTSTPPASTVATSSSAVPAGVDAEQWTVIVNQCISGMPKPTTLAEWQLQAVLFHAKLTFYYTRFISVGGDDIDQLMQCDETEFLEIMRLIGMHVKPLHVRRFQHTLAEFSKDRVRFLQLAVINIGPPPISADFPVSSNTTPLHAALAFLVPGFSVTDPLPPLPTEALAATMPRVLQQTAITTTSTSASASTVTPTTSPFFMSAFASSSTPALQTSSASPGMRSIPSVATTPVPSATANILTNTDNAILMRMVAGGFPLNVSVPMSTMPSSSSVPAFSSMSSDPTMIAGSSGCASAHSVPSPTASESEYGMHDSTPFEGGVLPESDIPVIVRAAKEIYDSDPTIAQLQPRYVQNKKKLPKDLIDTMTLPMDTPNRDADFRKYSAIYGRYDAKRKADKPLSYHELLVNEAAAQLCLLQPVLLTRRDSLFPLARRVVRDNNFPGLSTGLSRVDRKRLYESRDDRSVSPGRITPHSPSPGPSSVLRAASTNLESQKPSSSGDPERKRVKSEDRTGQQTRH